METNKEYNMLTEILAQKDVFKSLCNKFFDKDFNLQLQEFPIKDWNRIVVCASGSSKNASEIARYFIESIAKIPCCIEYSSEFAHKDIIIGEKDLFVAISQSGNTADTFEGLMRAKKLGATTFAITNDVTSKIHKNADFKVLADAGVEASIAATKSFTAQLFILYIFAMGLAEKIQNADLIQLKQEFCKIYENYDEIFAQRTANIQEIAQNISKAKSIAILGRNINSALALEGSLKIKETCYINANSSPAGEFMHGHFAVIDETIPIFGILNKSEDDEENYNLALHNLCEIQQKRKANIVMFKTKGDNTIKEQLQNKYCVEIPKINKWFAPFLNLVALQLVAYETAKLLHDNIDTPRDLIKCVACE